MSRYWSDEEVEQVVAWRGEGLTYREIGERFDTTPKAIERLWYNRGASVIAQQPVFVEGYQWPEKVDWREWCDLWSHINEAEKRSDPINEGVTINLKKLDRPIAIAFAGDLHMGGGFTSHDAIKSTVEFILDTPDLYVSFCGDLFEGFLPKFRSAEAREQMPGSVKSQIQAYRSLLFELNRAGKLIAVSYGDHDAIWFETTIGFNPAKHAIHDRVPYFPGRGIIRLKLGKQEYFIVQNHRERNSSQWNKVHPSRRQFDKFFPGDVMVTGHTHSPSYQMDYQLQQAREAGLGVGGRVWYVVCGTYKDGPDIYSIRGWQRGVIGVPTVIFQPDRHETLCLPSPACAVKYMRG
jgi:hypothetical protein